MNRTFYLKYRPQTFFDLDSTIAREELIKIFSSGNLPHAFLFSGTKGIGKTSAARIVAKAINCTGKKPKEFEPCNMCDNCLSITAGNNVDVMEIDAASFTGVDDIRDLRDKIRLAPAGLKYKVFIIDEVHRLSGSAFDALLKTLEEPPLHVIFILCTTDPEKLPKTIVSRCQRIAFRRATKKEIVERLKKNCRAERLEFEEEALVQIVKLSEGSFRDAVKILEQVSFSGKITIQEVNKIAGISGEYKPEEFLRLLAERQTKETLLWLGRAVEAGVSLKILLENLLEILRIIILSEYGVEEGQVEVNLTGEQAKELIDLLTSAYTEMKFAVIPQLPLEMAVIEWSYSAKASKDKEEKISLPSNAKFILEEIQAKWPEILEKVKLLNHSVLAFLKACRPKAIEGNFLVLEVFYKFHKDQLESEKCRQIFEKAASEVLNGEVLLKCVLSNEKPAKLSSVPLPEPSTKNEDGDDIIKVAEEIFNK